MGLGINAYVETYEKYKNFAEDCNIDLFICDSAMNEACSDAANTLKKPVVGFSSFFRRNYKFLIFYLKESSLNNVPSIFIYLAAPYETHKSDPMFNCNISLENESFFKRFKCVII